MACGGGGGGGGGGVAAVLVAQAQVRMRSEICMQSARELDHSWIAAVARFLSDLQLMLIYGKKQVNNLFNILRAKHWKQEMYGTSLFFIYFGLLSHASSDVRTELKRNKKRRVKQFIICKTNKYLM